MPIYVAYNPNAQSGTHNYTGNLYEENNLINLGWKYKAVAWNAVSLSVNPSNNSLQEIADALNTASSNIVNESGGIFNKVNVSASGNMLVVDFTFSRNLGSLSPDKIQDLKKQLTPLLTENQSIFQNAGISNLSIKYNFRNPDGSLVASNVYP